MYQKTNKPEDEVGRSRGWEGDFDIVFCITHACDNDENMKSNKNILKK